MLQQNRVGRDGVATAFIWISDGTYSPGFMNPNTTALTMKQYYNTQFFCIGIPGVNGQLGPVDKPEMLTVSIIIVNQYALYCVEQQTLCCRYATNKTFLFWAHRLP